MKKRIVSIVCALVLMQIYTIPLYAQDDFTTNCPMPYIEWRRDFVELKGSFLEANRFSTVYDRTPRRLRLEVGYGGEIMNIEDVGFGAEGLIWSGLKTLDNFRFPVETADYFFGLYGTFPMDFWEYYPEYHGRVRLSHISSHLVDGTQDSVIGGSSSKYSREFVSLDVAKGDYNDTWRYSLGIKIMFHQVTKTEPVIQFPLTLEWTFFKPSVDKMIFLSLGTANGPSFPVYSGSITFRLVNTNKYVFDTYGEYHNGISRYGMESSTKQNGFEIGIRVGAYRDYGFNIPN